MSTTSLKLPEDLKQRAASAAEGMGISTHAFMVEAIRRAADAAEQRAGLVAQALSARVEMVQSGMGHDPEQVHNYLRKRITNKEAPRPSTKPWRD